VYSPHRFSVVQLAGRASKLFDASAYSAAFWASFKVAVTVNVSNKVFPLRGTSGNAKAALAVGGRSLSCEQPVRNVSEMEIAILKTSIGIAFPAFEDAD
jgi:hypothetical protein